MTRRLWVSSSRTGGAAQWLLSLDLIPSAASRAQIPLPQVSAIPEPVNVDAILTWATSGTWLNFGTIVRARGTWA